MATPFKTVAEIVALRFSAELLKFLYSRLRNLEDARDFFQDLMIRLLKVDARDVENPLHYAMRAAANLLVDRSRKKKPPGIVPIEDVGDVPELSAEDDSLVTAEIQHDAVRAAQRLPKSQRREVYLAVVADRKSLDQIAKELEITEKTARTYYYQILLEVQAMIWGHGAKNDE